MTSRPCTPLKQRCSRDKVNLTSQLYCSTGAPYGHDPDTAPFSSAKSMRTMVGCRQLHTINSRSMHTSGMDHESAQHFFCKNKALLLQEHVDWKSDTSMCMRHAMHQESWICGGEAGQVLLQLRELWGKNI